MWKSFGNGRRTGDSVSAGCRHTGKTAKPDGSNLDRYLIFRKAEGKPNFVKELCYNGGNRDTPGGIALRERQSSNGTAAAMHRLHHNQITRERNHERFIGKLVHAVENRQL